MRWTAANVLRLGVMLLLAALAVLVFVAPEWVTPPPSLPPPEEDDFQDLQAAASAYRAQFLGTAENPLQVPAGPAGCALSLQLPVDQACNRPEGKGAIEGAVGECAVVPGEKRAFALTLPAEHRGPARCVVGACASPWVAVVDGAARPDPVVRGAWIGEACPAWPLISR